MPHLAGVLDDGADDYNIYIFSDFIDLELPRKIV